MDTVIVATGWCFPIFIGPLWFMMWFMPRSEITKKVIGDIRICIIPLIASYGVLLASNLLDILITLGSKIPTPDIVFELFPKDELMILAWLYFLVMNTFAGRYVWIRMITADKPVQFLMPILLACTMLCQIGIMISILTTLDVEDDILKQSWS